MPWMTRGLQVLDGAELVAAVIKPPGQRCMDMPGAADDPCVFVLELPRVQQGARLLR